MEQLETRIAHLERTLDDLSDTVARQDAELRRLTERIRLLTLREAEREAQGAGVILGDERPPHY